MKPADKRVAAEYLQTDYKVGLTRACGLIRISRSRYRYQSRRGDDSLLRLTIRQKAQQRKRWGYRRLQILLQREGHMDNHKRIYRIYREEGLQVDHLAVAPAGAAGHPGRSGRRTESEQ